MKTKTHIQTSASFNTKNKSLSRFGMLILMAIPYVTLIRVGFPIDKIMGTIVYILGGCLYLYGE